MMQIGKDLIYIHRSGFSELFIADSGYQGIQFIFIGGERVGKISLAPFELTPLIEKLTEFRDRNKKEGITD